MKTITYEEVICLAQKAAELGREWERNPDIRVGSLEDVVRQQLESLKKEWSSKWFLEFTRDVLPNKDGNSG